MNAKITLTLTAAEIEKAIQVYVRMNGYEPVTTCNFTITPRYEERSDYATQEFTGCSLEAKLIDSSKQQ